MSLLKTMSLSFARPPATVWVLVSGSLLMAPADAGTAVKLADHPTSKKTAFPAIHSARALRDRVYFGYGDWNDYVATALVSYDPAANTLAVEHSVSSDSIAMMREIDGTLYIPHCDPIHHEDFHDYSYCGPDGRWLQSAAMEQLHVYDFVKLPEGLFCGANGLYRSLDEGRTWSLVGSNFNDRLLWLHAFGGTVFSGSGTYRDGTFTARAATPEFNHSTPFLDRTSNTPLMLGMIGGTPGFPPSPQSALAAFDGKSTRALRSRVQGFAVTETEVFVLTNRTLQRTTDPSSPTPTFTTLDITGLPANAASLELLNGRFYIGTLTGEIWVAAADGSEVSISPPTVEYRSPDQFGRGLAFSGNRLLVGAPDDSSTIALAGRAELWSYTDDVWRRDAEWTSPEPDFSGWFGRDVALRGDLMAVVEAGHDLSGRSRGSSARVHVLQQSNGLWVSRRVFPAPFAHTVAFQDDLLVIGAYNSGSSTRPLVFPYRISRNDANEISMASMPQLAPTSQAFGYQPLARVALLDDLVIAGFSGDPSRVATGLLSVFRKNGPDIPSQPVQEIPVNAPHRFGFALAADNNWVAVGAPFEDTGATNAGAVFLYEKSSSSPPDPPLVARQTLTAPIPQAHAEFGASVALHGDLLLVGSPGREVNGIRQRGAVYRFRRQASGAWIPLGELDPPAASQSEFGIEVAVNGEWQAAGSLGSRNGATSLSSRIRLVPRSRYEEWLDTRQTTAGRGPLDDPESDGLPTLLEYVFNLNPSSADLPPATASPAEPYGVPHASLATDPARHTFTFVRPHLDPRLTVVVESSDDMKSWQEESGAPAVLASGTTHQLVALTSTAPTTARWWRLKALYKED
jgi:hypothetical protein